MKRNRNFKIDSKVELLAPAKDKATAIAAINCGADAIYMGASNFGARKNAANSLSDLKEIVEYAHRFNVRVHVTVNTILADGEINQTQKLIEELYEIGIDAIIVQDMAILELAIEGKLPPIEIHASTQCDNRTIEKVKFFRDLGVSRVILARELSNEQIKEICESLNQPLTSSHNLPDSPMNGDEECQKPIEVETFIHGALCVSYSGQCYLSESIGGRSANKGECAQPCRKKFTLLDEDGKIYAKDKHLLSLRDFNASKHIESLISAGVKSFKIEGRLKDENYVKNVVSFYRNEIDKHASKTSSGKVFCDFEPDLNKSFNRGFTDYFLESRKKCFNFDTPKSLGEKIGKVEKIGRDFFVLQNQSQSQNEAKCFSIEDSLSPQDGLFWGSGGCLVNKVVGEKIFPNKMGDIKVGDVVFRNFDSKFDKQLVNSKTKRQIGVEFEFKDGFLKVRDEDGNSVEQPIPAGECPKNPERMKETFLAQLQKTGESDFYAINVKISGELPFLPISAINEIRREMLEKLLAQRLKNYQRAVQKPLRHVDFADKKLDYRWNVNNEIAKAFYEKCGCEVSEYSPEKTHHFRGIELMRTKHCLKFAFDMCKSPKKLFLVDEKGKKYQLKFDCKNCEMVIED